MGQGLRDPCPVGPSCRCLDELHPGPGLERGCRHSKSGRGGTGEGGAGRWERCFILSPGGLALVSAAPGATRTAFEHLQREHQLLARCPGVWTGQYQLLLIGAKGVAAAAEGFHLVGVGVETKESAEGTWSSLWPRGRIPVPPQPPRQGRPWQGLEAGLFGDLPSCRRSAARVVEMGQEIPAGPA